MEEDSKEDQNGIRFTAAPPDTAGSPKSSANFHQTHQSRDGANSSRRSGEFDEIAKT